METNDWGCLPEHILVTIFQCLSNQEKLSMSLVCRKWQDAFQCPQLWQAFTFVFEWPHNARRLQFVPKFGKFLRNLTILVNQSLPENRQNACTLLESLAVIEKRRLSSLDISFTSENPLFYAGQEFVDSLKILFAPTTASIERPLAPLAHVNLSGLSVAFDDSLIDVLSANNLSLESLNIQNRSLVCKVSPTAMLRLVVRCRKLKDIRVFHCSMADDILDALCEGDRDDLQHLSIVCRREEKYGTDLSSESWAALVRKIPRLRVTLGFDHTCPFNLIPVILKPEIPVKTLKLETFTRIYDEVNMAASYYHSTLEKVVLQTRTSDALCDALLNLARRCSRLQCLVVYCVVKKEVVDEILALFPDMKERGSYILKFEMEPEPWVVGVEVGD